MRRSFAARPRSPKIHKPEAPTLGRVCTIKPLGIDEDPCQFSGQMRLAVFATHPIQYQAPLFRHLAATPGIDLEVLFGHDHGLKPDFDPQFGQAVKYDVPLIEGYRYRFLKNWSRRPGFGLAEVVNPEIVSVLRAGQFDAMVIQGYTTSTALMGFATPRASKTRILFRGESHLNTHRANWKRVVKEPVLRAIFSRVDQFLPIGTCNAEYLAHYGVRPERMTLAPYSVDNDYFANRSADARANPTRVRKELGLPPDIPLFLFCAKLIPVKRPLDLIRAFAKARAVHPCALAVVGSGELEREVRALLEQLHVPDVYMMGFRNQSELPQIYGACDALVLPSDHEPWGLVVNEAMASGAAIVVSDRIGSAVDLLRDNGESFQAGNIEDLARALTALAGDGEKLKRMGAASKRIIATWGIEQTAAGFIEGARIALART